MNIKEYAKSISGKEYGYPQFTKEEIEKAEGIGRTKSTVHTHMRRLEDEGIIIRKADYSSQYRLINMGLILKNQGG